MIEKPRYSRARLAARALQIPLTTALAALLVGGCAPAEPAACPEQPPPPPTAAKPAPAPVATPLDKPVGYTGLGVASVDPEILKRYAPTPLPSDLSRRIQAMLDVRSAAPGALSPDGKSLYFTWTVTGQRQVWRVDGPQRFPIQVTGGEDPTLLAEITPDGKYLVLSRDRKGEENPGLYLQDAKGGALTLVQHKPKVQTQLSFVTDDSKYIYFRSNDIKENAYAIYRYDVQKKERELLFDQDGIWLAVDYRPDGRLLLAKEVGSNMAEYFELDPKTKALTALFGQGEREDYEAKYGAADGEVIVQTPKIGEYRRLYSWKAGKLTPISPEMNFDVAAFSIDRKKQRILYLANEGGYMRLRGLDAKTHKELKLPAIPQADHVFFSATTPDGRFTTVSVDPGNAPPQSYVVEWQTGKLVAWHSPSTPEIDATKFVRPTLESYPARDGTKIPMFVWRPAACDKPCPVIVEFHGGPEGQALAGWNARAQIAVQAGFVFVAPNVRGSDGYGKTWIHADDGKKRLDVVTDIEDCAKFIRQSWAEGGKAPKIGIWGGSYGGYSALMGMTMFAGAYDAGAEFVGISNLLTFLQNTAPYRRILRISEYGDPEKDKEALVQLSPLTHLGKVKGPMLLMQGANDPRVPVGEAIQVHDALEAKKLPSQLIIFADEGHGAQKRENQVFVNGHMVRFFQEHLQGKK
jgi:dipeptidyl aminopeptidase/acylaminoacyl peptidase